jgi:hypothetical protein
MLLKSQTIAAQANPHNAPRTVQLIVHARVFLFTEGWNELTEIDTMFKFDEHAFNFDYILHLSGINYLIHPDDIQQVISMVQVGAQHEVEFKLRFINRSGEMKILEGIAVLVEKV